MISISRLLCDNVSPGDSLRYADSTQHGAIKRPPQVPPRPVVVWNCTRQCNLHCVHCYASAGSQKAPAEMDSIAGTTFIRDLFEFGAPVILFSGGEPLMREDLFELAGYARSLGMRVALSTNGTLIKKEQAKRLGDIGFAEVGISLDGIGENNDRFRGLSGAFDAALEGIRNCRSLGLRVSLRLTITAFNSREIPAVFDLIEREGIDRVCFYHLAYSGRGDRMRAEDLGHDQTRAVVDLICDRTIDLHERGLRKEILTVGNHTDGVYLYLKTRRGNPVRANKILDLLRVNGGNNSGIKIGAVDDQGNVHPDQFWRNCTLGNVCQKRFSEIWADTSIPILRDLRDRKGLLKGRCSRCHFIDLCNGNLRARAEAVHGDVWGEDPSCYLTEEEVAG